MTDRYFREILGVPADANRATIRQAYRRLVMENHPDRFPAERKPLQELAVITLTEAYNALMSQPEAARINGAARPTAARPSARPSAAAAPPPQPVARNAVAAHPDPAYAHYKQGFINFSMALHGIAEITARIAAGRTPRFTRRYRAVEDITASLESLTKAHGYFTRVAQEHPASIWSADSKAKLRRIENFTVLYRRILTNLGRT